MGMSAHENAGFVVCYQIERFPVVAPGEAAYMGHRNFHILRHKNLCKRICQPHIAAVAIAVYPNQGFECSYGVGTGNAAKVSGMPDYVHRLQKPLHIFCKNAVGIGNQAYIHINILRVTSSTGSIRTSTTSSGNSSATFSGHSIKQKHPL